MIRRDIQRLKVIVILLHLGALYDLITHSDKNAFHFLQGDRVRMAVPHFISLRGECHVDHFRFHLRLAKFSLHICLCLVKHLLNLLARIIDELSYFRSLLGRYILHPLQHGRQLAFFAQKIDTNIV